MKHYRGLPDPLRGIIKRPEQKFSTDYLKAFLCLIYLAMAESGFSPLKNEHKYLEGSGFPTQSE